MQACGGDRGGFNWLILHLDSTSLLSPPQYQRELCYTRLPSLSSTAPGRNGSHMIAKSALNTPSHYYLIHCAQNWKPVNHPLHQPTCYYHRQESHFELQLKLCQVPRTQRESWVNWSLPTHFVIETSWIPPGGHMQDSLKGFQREISKTTVFQLLHYEYLMEGRFQCRNTLFLHSGIHVTLYRLAWHCTKTLAFLASWHGALVWYWQLLAIISLSMWKTGYCNREAVANSS